MYSSADLYLLLLTGRYLLFYFHLHLWASGCAFFPEDCHLSSIRQKDMDFENYNLLSCGKAASSCATVPHHYLSAAVHWQRRPEAGRSRANCCCLCATGLKRGLGAPPALTCGFTTDAGERFCCRACWLNFYVLFWACGTQSLQPAALSPDVHICLRTYLNSPNAPPSSPPLLCCLLNRFSRRTIAATLRASTSLCVRGARTPRHRDGTRRCRHLRHGQTQNPQHSPQQGSVRRRCGISGGLCLQALLPC